MIKTEYVCSLTIAGMLLQQFSIQITFSINIQTPDDKQIFINNTMYQVETRFELQQKRKFWTKGVHYTKHTLVIKN